MRIPRSFPEWWKPHAGKASQFFIRKQWMALRNMAMELPKEAWFARQEEVDQVRWERDQFAKSAAEWQSKYEDLRKKLELPESDEEPPCDD